MTDLASVGEDAREASRDLALLSTAAKNAILAAMADALRDRAPEILEANANDVDAAVVDGRDASLVDRLTLTPERLADISSGVMKVVELQDPVGVVEEARSLPNGLEIGR